MRIRSRGELGVCRCHVARINDPPGEAVLNKNNLKNRRKLHTNVQKSESRCGRIIDPRYIIRLRRAAEDLDKSPFPEQKKDPRT